MSEELIFDNRNKKHTFYELFDLEEIQKLQDSLSAATGVASLITEPDGTPITKPSGFCNLCTEIRKTEIGRKNCLISDSIIGGLNKKGPNIQRCLSGGLLDGGASIIVAGEHIANWLVGQVLDEAYGADQFQYADLIGMDQELYQRELLKVKRMTRGQFENICNYLFLTVQQLSSYALQNSFLEDKVNEKIHKEIEITNLNKDLEQRIQERTIQLEETNALLEETNALLEETNAELQETNAELEEMNAVLEEEIIKRQKAEDEVKVLNEDLEKKVIARTIQLQDLNSILEEEIIERIRAENELNKERVFTDALFHSAQGMIYLYDDKSKLVRWNDKHEEMTGYSAEELAEMHLLDWYEGDQASQKAVLDGLAMIDKTGFGNAEANLRKKDGTRIPMLFTASKVMIDDKQYFAGVGIDITEWKQLNERLHKYQVLAEKSKDPMLFVDKQGNILEVNNAAAETYGYTYAELLSMTIYDLRHCSESAEIAEQMELADKEGILFDTVHYLKDGTSINVEVSSQGTMLGGRRVLLSIVRDITDRKRREDENRFLSYHDPLTGLYNRRFYEEAIKQLDTEENIPISIIIGDVNGLKLVNDAFGHDIGDKLLQEAGKAIQSACRNDDIVARWGGDEFVILLPKTASEEAEKLVVRIRENYSDVLINAIRMSISFGWETKKNPGDDILKILKSAEDIMYKHKVIENEGMRGNTINTIINTLHEKNPREEQHSKRVSQICQDIGRTIGLSEIEISRLKVVGLLHDIGKIAIEEGILNKPGKLTDREWDDLKRHPDIGYRILSSSYEMVDLADCILAHHERWDGKGYPKGLKGEAIPLVSRIIALADSYDAMISERPYRVSLTEKQALEEIRRNSGTQFDPAIAGIFIEKLLSGYPKD
ncbi:PocR ligand-binding domain-containing protein [Desulfosporosinus youngiae]|uniref:PAS domain S-box/diguanylate cyclase (GGDEF) domain-containing protein n=1 Tax=Desulfosporosinus youngiae DSM 17734 TaxID=768710 RepID=H5Y532_9FIRM|nr:PocR ligand-binding domain-containing protein [Desulfosporosinus youngiae]EHQ90136.1 PAS domain S-box/diguanylate cyclase (GGDEF) domain-containing protein [Desulfosporosinus youngiae DSM 17734]